MKYAPAALCALMLLATSATAQRTKSFGPELRPFVAAYVPMGAMSALAEEKTYLIHYDVGAEASLLYEIENSWLFSPSEHWVSRQYMSCFESPITGEKKTRTDALFSLGLAYHIR